MQAPAPATEDRPTVGKTFRVTQAQNQVIEEFLRDQGDSFGNFTQVIDTALQEFFQRRRVRWPETRYRRSW